MASAIFKSARWRCDGVESRHSTNASLAALKAASISAAFDLGAVAKGCPVAGLIKVADLIVAKHRNGPTRTITVSAQLHYARFYDMPQNPGGGQDWTQQRESTNTPPEDNFGA